jgi:tRNA pseudouridine55 synthase
MATPERDAPRGWLVDKPAGPTSHDVVARVRRGLPRGTKVGHAGTLDPFATGLLVVLAGRATRLARLLSDLPKRYTATVRLGSRSATGDPEGPVTPGGRVPGREAIEAALREVGARGTQRVPAFAAVRVDGERMYRRARRGEDVERPERPVVLYDLRLIAHRPDQDEIDIETRVSSGTYVRQVAVDIGEALGCGGWCAALRRTEVGGLSVAGAVAPEAVALTPPVPLPELLGHLPRRDVGAAGRREVAHGRAVPVPPGVPADAEVLLTDGEEPVALARVRDGLLRPSVVLVDPEPAR